MSDVPDPEVPERARRRTYTAKYKRDVLAEYEAADRVGKGALLRREGLYTSLISAWREQRDKGALEALGKPSGAVPADPAAREAARLRRENERLTVELDEARRVIEVQHKTPAEDLTGLTSRQLRVPSRKAINSITARVSAATYRHTLNEDLAQLLRRLNRMLAGWANYFRHGVSKEGLQHDRSPAWNRIAG